MPQTDEPQRATTPGRPSGVPQWLVLVITLVSLAAGGLIALTATDQLPRKHSGTVALPSPLTYKGTPTDAKLAAKLSEDSLRSSRTVTVPAGTTSSALYLSEQNIDSVAFLALIDVDNLRGWGFCADELTAEAEILRAFQRAVVNFPRDMPYDSARALDTRVDEVKKETALAETFEQAARIATRANPPLSCTNDKLTNDRWLIFTMNLDVRREAAIPDSDVLRQARPVEELVKYDRCVNTLAAERKKMADRPIAKTTETKSRYDEVFSEAYKARELARYDAQIKLMTNTGHLTC